MLTLDLFLSNVDITEVIMYYVLYTEDCSPKIKSFKSKPLALAFVASFKLQYQNKSNEEDNWIDLIFSGDIIFSDRAIEESHVKTR
jgi:hypothetical protein